MCRKLVVRGDGHSFSESSPVLQVPHANLSGGWIDAAGVGQTLMEKVQWARAKFRANKRAL